jgi:glycosyltransferase involved in cell wall biosynthesis
MNKLSVVIITHNEEENLPRCLQSVKWADQIIVVDSHSSDRTPQIAAKFGCKYFDLDWHGFGAAKQAALEKATGEWVLSIDADEAVSDELKASISSAIFSSGPTRGYEFSRLTNFLGRWIRHCGWYPDYILRLFRRDSGKFNPLVVHESIAVNGPTGRLKGDLLHYSYPNLEKYFAKSNRYTTLGAEEALRLGKHAGMADLIFRPPVSFFKHYIQKAGFLDGPQGLMVSTLSAAAVFNKYAKLWQLERQADTANGRTCEK